MNKPIKTGVIGLLDLPSDKILIGLKKPFKENIIKAVKHAFGDVNTFTKTYNKKPSSFYNFKNNQKTTLKFLLEISNILVKKGFKQINPKNIEKNIEIMGTKRGNIYLHKPNLPFNFNNKEGAYFISAIFFDGGIDKEFKPHYGNNYLHMRKRTVNGAKKIFGEIKSKETNAKRGALVRFPKTMGIILNSCFNIGAGNKMYHNNKIPDFIFNLNKNNKACFIKQAFDDDGTVSVEKKTIRVVGSKAIKKEDFNKNNTDFNLLNGLKKLLIDFNIDANPLRLNHKSFSNKQYGKKGEFYSHVFAFSITGRTNLETFHSTIGFNLDYKMKRLKKILKNYKQSQLRKGELHKLALECCKRLEKKDGFTTNLSLAKEINRSYRQTVRVLKTLEKKKLIELTKPSVNIGGRRHSAIYNLISEKAEQYT